MIRPTNSLGDVVLERMDRWSRSSHWLPRQAERLPGTVFWGIFGWNFPILLVSIGIIGLMLYRSTADSSGIGAFSTLDWRLELAIGTVSLSFLVDFFGCLWLRGLWNKRARLLADGAQR